MSTAKEYKIVLAGAFGSGRTTFASRVLSASKNKKTIKAIKTENCPVELYTSAGKVVLSLFDTTLHAKGGIPDDAFFRTADAGILFFDLTSEDRLVTRLSLFELRLGVMGADADSSYSLLVCSCALPFVSDSYNKAEEWYDALIKANGRKGSEPLPVIVVGTKADDIKVSVDENQAAFDALSPLELLERGAGWGAGQVPALVLAGRERMKTTEGGRT